MKNMNHKQLASKFPDQKLVKVIAAKPDNSLSIKEAWVYSRLLWGYKGKPVSKARLANKTGVDRTRTLPRILTRLSNLRLVVTTGKKFKAVEPPADMLPLFYTWIRGWNEYEKEVPSYNWAFYQADRDIIDSLVACADAQGHHAAAKLAKRFCVCAKTIAAARRRIRKPLQDSTQVANSEMKSVVSEDAPRTLITSEANVPVAALSLDGYEVPTDVSAASPSFTTRHRVDQFSKYHGMKLGATKELEKFCELFTHLTNKETGQIISALVKKYGTGEGLEDGVWTLLQRRYYEYRFPTAYEKVMKDIGVGCKSYSDYDTDDDLSIFGDEETEMAMAE